MAIRAGLLWEILVIAVETLRANKLRSALTILGVVIGVMSIVAMTALIKGFGDSLENQIRAFGSNTVFVQKLGFQSFSSGRSFLEVIKRPNLTNDDAKAIGASPLVGDVGLQFGGGGPFAVVERMTFAGVATKQFAVIGATAQGSILAGIGEKYATSAARMKPRIVPMTPPNTDSVVDSVRTCQTMSRRRAPSALRSPISRVRSLTTISMMFMITMPPTTSDSATTPTRTAKTPLVAE